MEYEVTSVQTIDSIEEIAYTAISEDGETKVTIGIDHGKEHFRFVYVKGQ